MNLVISNRVRFPVALAVLLLAETYATAGIVDFEDLTPTTPYTGLGGGEYWNGSDGSGEFASGGATFLSNYSASWGSWDGWSYSNTSDTTTAGYTNQYSDYTGANHSDPGKNYGVYCEPWSLSPTVTFAPGITILGAWITNTTYAALSMFNGDSFAKKFGGESGDDADWFKVTIKGIDSSDQQTGEVDFYLADYRFADAADDYIVDTWTWVDLTRLGDATKLAFDLSSSDVGQWGMNTPAYFAIDDIAYSAVPEPGTLAIMGSGGLVLGAVSLLRRRFSRRASNG